MHPVKTTATNHTYGANQSEYTPYPGHLDPDGVFTGCWALTRSERLQILLTGRIWVKHYTFGGKLQPFAMQVHTPVLEFAMAEPPSDYVPAESAGNHAGDHAEKNQL